MVNERLNSLLASKGYDTIRCIVSHERALFPKQRLGSETQWRCFSWMEVLEIVMFLRLPAIDEGSGSGVPAA